MVSMDATRPAAASTYPPPSGDRLQLPAALISHGWSEPRGMVTTRRVSARARNTRPTQAPNQPESPRLGAPSDQAPAADPGEAGQTTKASALPSLGVPDIRPKIPENSLCGWLLDCVRTRSHSGLGDGTSQATVHSDLKAQLISPNQLPDRIGVASLPRPTCTRFVSDWCRLSFFGSDHVGRGSCFRSACLRGMGLSPSRVVALMALGELSCRSCFGAV
jgi:hypothetical protein